MTFEDKTSHLVSSLLFPMSVIPGCLDVFFCPGRWCLNWFLGWELFRCMSLGDSVPEGPRACRWDRFPKDGASALHAKEKMKRTVVKMHGILRVSNCSTKIGIEISDLMSAFSVRSEQFSNKTFHTGIQNPNGGPKIYGISSPKIFDEIFQKVFQMCNDSTAQTQRRAPTHRHGHRDLIRKHLLATQNCGWNLHRQSFHMPNQFTDARGRRNFAILSYLRIWCPLPKFCTWSMPRGCSLLLSKKSSRVSPLQLNMASEEAEKTVDCSLSGPFVSNEHILNFVSRIPENARILQSLTRQLLFQLEHWQQTRPGDIGIPTSANPVCHNSRNEPPLPGNPGGWELRGLFWQSLKWKTLVLINMFKIITRWYGTMIHVN